MRGRSVSVCTAAKIYTRHTQRWRADSTYEKEIEKGLKYMSESCHVESILYGTDELILQVPKKELAPDKPK